MVIVVVMCGKAVPIMKQNEFIDSVLDILRPYGEKYSKYEVEGAIWDSLRSLNFKRGKVDYLFTKNQESFVRRVITNLVLSGNKVWNYTIGDVKKYITRTFKEGTE